MRFVAMIAVPALGAAGVASLIESPMPRRRAWGWLAAGAALWLGVPLIMRGNPIRFGFLAAATLVAIPLLVWLATRRAPWAGAAVVGLLVFELVAATVYAQRYRATVTTGLEGDQRGNLIVQPLRSPDVDLDAFLAPTPFVDLIGDDPYLTWAPPASYFEKGYLFAQEAEDWPGLTMSRGTLFGLRDVLGYNPVQMPRYWSFIRARSSLPIFYNASVIDLPTRRDTHLLGVRWLIVPAGLDLPVVGTVVASADRFDLVELDGGRPRAELFTSWRVLDRDDALRAVADPAFDPTAEVIVEADPGVDPTGHPPGSATVVEPMAEELVITTSSDDPSVLMVRTSYDEGWSATVDGVAAEVIATDAVFLGVALDAGSHEVRLEYRDPAIAAGVVAGVVVWLGWALAVGVTWVSRRRRPSP